MRFVVVLRVVIFCVCVFVILMLGLFVLFVVDVVC